MGRTRNTDEQDTTAADTAALKKAVESGEPGVEVVVDGNLTSILTPYGAAKIANLRFTEAGIKVVPPQMLYNYTTAKVRKGQKPLITWSAEDGVDREDLERWITSYIAKKVATATKVEAELAGDATSEV